MKPMTCSVSARAAGLKLTSMRRATSSVLQWREPARGIAHVSLDVIEAGRFARDFVARRLDEETGAARTRVPVVIQQMMETRLGDGAPRLAGRALEGHD